jgi:ABC-2 type transport system ATP-binding protein
LKDILLDLKSEGVTILFSTHIIALSEQLCDRVIIMNRGSIAAEGTRDDLKHYAQSSDKTLEDVFLRLTSDYER